MPVKDTIFQIIKVGQHVFKHLHNISVHETLSDRLTCQTKIILVRQILLLHRTGGPVKFLDENVLTMFRSGKNLIGQVKI